jgi:hypothetical protein
MSDLVPYIGEHDPICGHLATGPIAAITDARTRSGRFHSSARVGPPIVHAVELTPAAPIMMFARLGTRPIWDVGPIKLTRKRGGFEGRQKAKNFYTTGSRFHLELDPPVQEIAAARFDYMVWHSALVALAMCGQNFRDIALQQPKAPAAPWRDGEEAKPLRRVLPSPPMAPVHTRLRLKPERELTLPQERTGSGPGRHVPLTTPDDTRLM